MFKSNCKNNKNTPNMCPGVFISFVCNINIAINIMHLESYSDHHKFVTVINALMCIYYYYLRRFELQQNFISESIILINDIVAKSASICQSFFLIIRKTIHNSKYLFTILGCHIINIVVIKLQMDL